jgi:hypothetical protein
MRISPVFRPIFFAAAFSLGGLGCGSDSDAPPVRNDDVEISPEEFALELGLEPDSGPRVIRPENFPDFPLVVDIFRRSSKLPVLGEFRDEYIDLLATDRTAPADARAETARKRFADLATREFAIVSLRGQPQRAQIISGGLEGYAEGGFKTTPPGNYRLSAIAYEKTVDLPDGSRAKKFIPYPWLRSRRYNNSQMFWGLWIFGGYFMHSTTHYGELGRPASMGCIRQTYPDAMELFRQAQRYPAMIRIHPIGSQQAYDRVREIGGVAWALPRLEQNLAQIRAYVAYAKNDEIVNLGHAWIDPSTGRPSTPAWPNCGPVDCFEVWGKKPPTNP